MVQKLTGWIDGNLAPVRKGVYQRHLGPGRRVYAYWTGELWRYSATSPESAAEQWAPSNWQPGRRRGNSRYIPWRGLAKEPK